MRYNTAILRAPGGEIKEALSQEKGERPNYEIAIEQHNNYANSLKQLGVMPIVLPADPKFPDGCFTEDTFLILPEIVIGLNPGAPTRQQEVESLLGYIPKDRPYVKVPNDITIDGGDILVVGKKIYIGLSARTMKSAVDVINNIVSTYHYEVIAVDVPSGLHLKSGVTCLNEKVFMMHAMFEDIFKKLHGPDSNKTFYVVSPEESNAANVLPLNDGVVIPAGCPKAKAFIQQYYPSDKIIEVNTDEFRKVDGALTCLSIPFRMSEE